MEVEARFKDSYGGGPSFRDKCTSLRWMFPCLTVHTRQARQQDQHVYKSNFDNKIISLNNFKLVG